MKKINYLFLFVVFFLVLRPLYAQEPSNAEWIKTISIGAAGLGTGAALMLVPTPDCRWCAPNALDEKVSSALILKNTAPIRLSSDIIAFGLTPILAFGSLLLGPTSTKSFIRDALVIADALAITAALTEIAKISARRARPDSIYGDDHGPQANRSFWSGHTSFTFAALSSASVLALRNNYAWAPYFAGAAALVGTFVGYSRIAASRHWFSDVIVGMGVGIGVGVAMPFLTLDPKSPRVTIASNPPAFLLGFAW